MRLSHIQSSVRSRLRHPGWWTAGIALAMLPCLFALLIPRPLSARLLLGLMWIIPVAILGLLLCPTPWQWTADDRPLASGWRGVIQLLGFALLLGTAMSPMGWLAGKASAREAFRLGEILGFSMPFVLFLGPAGWVVARAERLAGETLEAQARARETQWMSHRGAFSPRLLFSNLSHLATLAGKDSRSAEQGLVDLAALYRRWLMEAELPLVPLATDRSLTEQYLALERQRWGDRLRLRWHLDPDQDCFQVPPLFLQPLLECALAADALDLLEVDLHEGLLAPGLLELRLRVQGPVAPPADGLLQSLRQRLQSTLGRDADASLIPSSGGWEASLRLPTLKGQAQP